MKDCCYIRLRSVYTEDEVAQLPESSQKQEPSDDNGNEGIGLFSVANIKRHQKSYFWFLSSFFSFVFF